MRSDQRRRGADSLRAVAAHHSRKGLWRGSKAQPAVAGPRGVLHGDGRRRHGDPGLLL